MGKFVDFFINWSEKAYEAKLPMLEQFYLEYEVKVDETKTASTVKSNQINKLKVLEAHN